MTKEITVSCEKGVGKEQKRHCDSGFIAGGEAFAA
jgi:hypothetical protein